MAQKTRDERPEADEAPEAREPKEAEDVREESAQHPPDEEETLESLRAQRDEYLARWQRAQADYKNARRRGLSEQEAEIRRSLQPILEDMLLVLDYLEMALAYPTTNDESRGLATGVQLTRDQLVGVLERSGVRPIEEEEFDPALHQAVDTVPADDVEPGTIVETRRRGYRWGETVLRFGQVVVARSEGEAGPGASASDAAEGEER